MSDDQSDSSELGQKPTINSEFKPISEPHRREKRRVEEVIDAYAGGGEPTPLSIRGPFRTGKTALQYHGFKHSWSQGLPAVYVEAKTLIREYNSTVPFEDWILGRVQAEVSAMANRDVDNIDWVPDTGSGTDLEAWLEEHVPEEVEVDRTVLLIDEVEQSYEDFLSATGVDDDNPLRKLLDESRVFPVLSMGQLSAFEFVGDADLGRMEPVSIPPVTINHVEALLDDHVGDPALGRVIFWLTRGRAARVHQLVTEASKRDLSLGDHELVATWLAEHSQERSTEFQPIRQVWENQDIPDPEEAAGALAFDVDGYDEWLVESENWYPAEEVVDVFEDILLDENPYCSADVEKDVSYEARRILRECTRWVVWSVAMPVDGEKQARAVPTSWLITSDESKAVLNLIQDFLLAFEAERDARDLAFDTLEAAKEGFNAQYMSKIAAITAEKGSAWTILPSVLQTAFPPLATDPSRLADEDSGSLKQQMGRGLEISVPGPVTTYACPSQDAFVGQLRDLSPDPTRPVAILVEEDSVDVRDGLEQVPVAQQLEAHNVLKIVPVSTRRVWEFVANVYGLLDGSSEDPYRATSDVIAAQVDAAEKRETRTTLETLYAHLTERVGSEAAAAAVEQHTEQFTDAPVWADEEIAGESWVNPKASFQEGRHAVATLLLLGDKPDPTDSHGKLLNTIEDALESDVIDTKGTFHYKELLGHVTGSGEYGKSIRTPRRICRNASDSGLSAPVARLDSTFSAVLEATGNDIDECMTALYRDQTPNGDIPAATKQLLEQLNPAQSDEKTKDVLWAVLTSALARRDDTQVLSLLESAEKPLNELIRALEGYEKEIEEANGILSPGNAENTGVMSELAQLESSIEQQMSGDDQSDDETGTVYGNGPSLDSTYIKTYRENLETVVSALEDARNRAADDADFRPTAYAMAVLAARYESVVRDAVDELDRGTPDISDLSDVKQLRDSVDQLVGYVKQETDYDEEFTNATETFAHEALDLNEVLQSNEIPVGDPDGNGMSTVHRVNTAARHRVAQVQELLTDVQDLQQALNERSTKKMAVRGELYDLINTLDQTAESDQASPQATKSVIEDGGSGEADGQQSTTKMEKKQ